jgi:hypothetical protein
MRASAEHFCGVAVRTSLKARVRSCPHAGSISTNYRADIQSKIRRQAL